MVSVVFRAKEPSWIHTKIEENELEDEKNIVNFGIPTTPSFL